MVLGQVRCPAGIRCTTFLAFEMGIFKVGGG